MMADREVAVIVQIAGEDVLAGRLWAHRRQASESATFSYALEYLARRDAYELDPMLPLSEGQQQTPLGRPIFGALSDCSPDRWGRRLIHRAEQQRARDAKAAERSYGEIDYLLGVRDAHEVRGVPAEARCHGLDPEHFGQWSCAQH
jgi:serine/threonine-protein kinase HipA